MLVHVLRAVAIALVTVVALATAAGTWLALAAARHRRRHPEACPFETDAPPAPWPARGLAALARGIRETTALIRLTPAALLPLRTGGPVACGAHRPLVLVSGSGAGPGVFRPLVRHLRRHGWETVAAVHGRGDPATRVRRLDRAIDRLCERSEGTVDLLAYGTGGLVARACLAARDGRGVARLVTVGTPHQGTDALPGLASIARPGSDLLREVGTADPVPALVECLSIYSRADALVLPPAHGYYPGAFNIEIQDLGHASLLFDRRVRELVHENLAAPAALPGRASRVRAS